VLMSLLLIMSFTHRLDYLVSPVLALSERFVHTLLQI
jgi:hypothetical protein